MLLRRSRRPHARRQDRHYTTYTTTYLYLFWHPLFLSLRLTVVIPQACRCIHRESRPLLSAGSVLGWLHLVKSVSHRAAAHVALAAPIVFNVPDMWSRAEDNLLVQTISTKMRLTSYNPDWDVWWNRVAEEIPGRLPQQCRVRYMPAAFLAQLTWVFLRISVGRVRCAPACVSNDSRSKGSDTATIAYASPPSDSADSARPIHYSTPVLRN